MVVSGWHKLATFVLLFVLQQSHASQNFNLKVLSKLVKFTNQETEAKSRAKRAAEISFGKV